MIVDTPKLINLEDGLRASGGICTHDAESNGSAGRLLNYSDTLASSIVKLYKIQLFI